MSEHRVYLTRTHGLGPFKKVETVTITASGWGHLAIVIDLAGEVTHSAERDFEGPFERDQALETAVADFVATGYVLHPEETR